MSADADLPASPARPPANPLGKAAAGVLLLVLLLFALSVLMERLSPVTSQAIVQAYVVRMAPDVAGRVIEVNVADNARVEAGTVLFRIDPRPFELDVAEAQAQVERVGQSLGASTSAVESAQARLVKANADYQNVQSQSQRVFELVNREVLARSKGDEARAALNGARASVTGAQAELEKAQKELGPRGTDNPQLKAALATLERARLNLLLTTVVAPASGVVTNLQLATGQFIGVGQPALTFIDASTVWVSASYKENSLEHMSPSDMAEVVFDSLPGAVFRARVESIGWGVSEGNLDPNTGLPIIRNESGWVREQQRFPVRLIMADEIPRGPRFGSKAVVVVYSGDNALANALGALWIRAVSLLTYLS